MKLQLRLAAGKDQEQVADILIRARAAFMPYAPLAHSESDLRAWVVNELLPSGGVTVATFAGAVVGVLVVSRHGGYSWIDQMYVSPALAGQGIGSRLLKHALLFLEPPIRLHTFQANLGARRFYERNGFKVIESTDGQGNEEQSPDILLEWQSGSSPC